MTELNIPDLARDCVYTSLNQSDGHVQTLETVMAHHGLGPADMLDAMRRPEFRERLKFERARAEELGARAGHVFRVEGFVTRLIEILYVRLSEADVPELIKGIALLSRMAGLDELPGRAADRGPAVAVQINVPSLSNPKLAHLKGA